MWNKTKVEMTKNRHGYNEIKINLNETSLIGSDSSFEPSNNTYSSWFVSFNFDTFYKDVYENCTNNATCRGLLSSDAKLLNAAYDQMAYLYKDETQVFINEKNTEIEETLNDYRRYQFIIQNYYQSSYYFDQTKAPAVNFNIKFKELYSEASTALNKIFMAPVLNDQIEYFEQSNLNYPFINRKSNIAPQDASLG